METRAQRNLRNWLVVDENDSTNDIDLPPPKRTRTQSEEDGGMCITHCVKIIYTIIS